MCVCAVPSWSEVNTDAPESLPITSTKNVRLDIENGIERSFFYTQYQIGGSITSRGGVGLMHFPISELKFPLDAFMINATINLTLFERLTLHYGVKKNIQNKVGKMKDSDWMPYPGIKTIYSESDTRINSIINEADLIVRLFTFSFFSLKIGAGFLHQYLDFSCSNVVQESVYDSSSTTGIGSYQIIKIPGKILTYLVQYYMFTMQITPVFTVIDRLEISLAIRFSPYLKARDVDDHILRGKKSKSDTKGTAFLPTLRISYLFSTRITITAKIEFLYLKTSGRQTQSYYLPTAEANYIPGWYAWMDTRLESIQLSVGLGAGYSFEF